MYSAMRHRPVRFDEKPELLRERRLAHAGCRLSATTIAPTPTSTIGIDRSIPMVSEPAR